MREKGGPLVNHMHNPVANQVIIRDYPRAIDVSVIPLDCDREVHAL